MASAKIKKAIIPVAGLGTRFLPATKAQPKEMLAIVDKPAIQYLVEEAVASGIKEIIFVTGKEKRAIEDHFDETHQLENVLLERGKVELARAVKNISELAKFAYVRQPRPNGNGAALLAAAHLVGDEPVAVLFGDDIIDSKVPTLRRLMDFYSEFDTPIVALQKIKKSQVSNYGVVSAKKFRDNLYKVKEIIEKPKPEEAPSNLGVFGRYVITKDIFTILRKMEQNRDWSSGGEIGIVDAFAEFLKFGEIIGYEFEGTYYDCGSKLGFLKAVINYGLKHPEVGDDLKKFLKSLKF